jgi:RIO kinase 1
LFPERISTPDSPDADEIDPRFVFDFQAYDDLDDEHAEEGRRWSTWLDF